MSDDSKKQHNEQPQTQDTLATYLIMEMGKQHRDEALSGSAAARKKLLKTCSNPEKLIGDLVKKNNKIPAVSENDEASRDAINESIYLYEERLCDNLPKLPKKPSTKSR